MISTRAMQKTSSIKITFKVCNRCDALWDKNSTRHSAFAQRKESRHCITFLQISSPNPHCRINHIGPEFSG